jgi:hypothetical protein
VWFHSFFTEGCPSLWNATHAFRDFERLFCPIHSMRCTEIIYINIKAIFFL